MQLNFNYLLMSNYISLKQLIVNNKKAMCRKISGLSVPSDAEKIKLLCIDFVNSITKKDAEYMMQLSLLEQDLIFPVLKVMDTIYASDIELSKKISLAFSQQKQQTPKSIRKKTEPSLAKEYGPALAGAAGGTLLATICKPTSWGVILMGSVISAIIGKVLYGLYIDKDNNVIAQYGDIPASNKEYMLTEEDAENIYNALVSAGECIDKVLLTYRKHLGILENDFKKKEETYDLEKKYLGVLECYQALLGNLSDMDNSPVVSDSVRKIIQTLQKQGFKPIDYSQDVAGLFNMKEEDVEDAEQFTPAIVKISDNKETLILKGDVIIPKNR